MIKNLTIIFLLVVSTTLAIAGTSSSSSSEFGISGCELSNGGYLAVGECSNDGMFYCGSDVAPPYNTLDTYFACSYMKSSTNSIPMGKSVCCPRGYSCSDDGSGQLICNMATDESCSSHTSGGESECKANSGCCWINNGCTECPEYCSYYQDQNSCEEDIWNVAKCDPINSYDQCGEFYLLSGCACE